MTETVSFLVEKQKITGTLFFPKVLKGRLPAVLFIHGWTSNEKGYSRRAFSISQLGYICLTFNLRGHGTSGGDLEGLSRKDHLQDCLAAYDFLASQPLVNKNQVHVVGASYGGYLGLLLSRKRPIKSLVLRAPALYPDKEFTTPTPSLIRKDIEIYRQQNLSYYQNKSLSGLHCFKKEVLIIESEEDRDVPKATINNYLRAANNRGKLTHVIVPQANHGLSQPRWQQFFVDQLVAWFKKQKRR